MELEKFKTEGKPIYVPTGVGDGVILKGWEIGNDFKLSPDYVEPKLNTPTVQPIQYRCQKCGREIPDASNKGIVFKNGTMTTLIMCSVCIKHG